MTSLRRRAKVASNNLDTRGRIHNYLVRSSSSQLNGSCPSWTWDCFSNLAIRFGLMSEFCPCYRKWYWLLCDRKNTRPTLSSDCTHGVGFNDCRVFGGDCSIFGYYNFCASLLPWTDPQFEALLRCHQTQPDRLLGSVLRILRTAFCGSSSISTSEHNCLSKSSGSSYDRRQSKLSLNFAFIMFFSSSADAGREVNVIFRIMSADVWTWRKNFLKLESKETV